MKYENFIEFVSNFGDDIDELNLRWKELSEKELNKEEKLRKKERKVSIITIIIIVAIDAFILLKIKLFSIFILMLLSVVDLIIYIGSKIVFINVNIMYFYDAERFNNVEQFDKDYKDKIINKMLENFIEELDYIPSKGLPSNIYDEVNDEYYNRYYSNDYFEGKINGRKIVMADLLVKKETKEKDEDGREKLVTTTIFNGLFGKIDLNKSINSNLTITEGYQFPFFDGQKLEMDSYEFEKAFNVYTDDRMIAMQLLTSDIQEDILDLYNRYNISFDISIINDKMYVSFSTGDMFEVFSTKSSPNEVLEEHFYIMKFIYKLVDKIFIAIGSAQI